MYTMLKMEPKEYSWFTTFRNFRGQIGINFFFCGISNHPNLKQNQNVFGHSAVIC